MLKVNTFFTSRGLWTFCKALNCQDPEHTNEFQLPGVTPTWVPHTLCPGLHLSSKTAPPQPPSNSTGVSVSSSICWWDPGHYWPCERPWRKPSLPAVFRYARGNGVLVGEDIGGPSITLTSWLGLLLSLLPDTNPLLVRWPCNGSSPTCCACRLPHFLNHSLTTAIAFLLIHKEICILSCSIIPLAP